MSRVFEVDMKFIYHFPSQSPTALGYNISDILEWVKRILKRNSVTYKNIEVITNLTNRQVLVEVKQ